MSEVDRWHLRMHKAGVGEAQIRNLPLSNDTQNSRPRPSDPLEGGPSAALDTTGAGCSLDWTYSYNW